MFGIDRESREGHFSFLSDSQEITNHKGVDPDSFINIEGSVGLFLSLANREAPASTSTCALSTGTNPYHTISCLMTMRIECSYFLAWWMSKKCQQVKKNPWGWAKPIRRP